MVGDAALREVVSANFCTTVARGNQRLAAIGNIVNILLVLLVVNKGVETAQGALLVLGLVARLSTFYEDFLGLASVGVLPHVTQTHTRFHLIHVLTTGTAGAERVPLNLAFVNMNLKLVGFWQNGHRGCRSLHAAVRLRDGHSLHTMHTRFVFQRAIDVGTRNGKVDFLIAAHGTFVEVGDRELPTLRLAETLIHIK